MTEQEIEAISGGYHGDAFAVLGPHSLGSENGSSGKAHWEVRTLQPQAKEVTLRFNATDVPMERSHPAGLFTASVPTQPTAYTLMVTDYAGHTAEVEDAYRFQPLISDFDLHLHSEGTNYEGYNSFGAHVVTVEGVVGNALRFMGAQCNRSERCWQL